MKNKILELALLQPNGFPWEKAKLDMSREEIGKVLKQINLYNKIQRRATIRRIKIIVLQECRFSKNINEAINKIKEACKGIVEVNDDIARGFLRKLNLNDDECIKRYNDFVSGNINSKEINITLEKDLVWLVECLSMFYLVKSEISLDELLEKIDKYMNKNMIDEKYKLYLKSVQVKCGIVNDIGVINTKKNIKGYSNIILKLFSNIDRPTQKDIDISIGGFSENTNEEFDIDSIVDIFLNEPTALDFTEEEQKKEEAEGIVENEKKSGGDFETKKGVDKKEVDSQGITITKEKEKEEKLIANDKEREIKIIKELAHLKNGAVLSELYNCYKNIDNISKDNLEITLSNFFNALNMYGIEVIDESIKVGQDIQVDTKEVLKEFIFTSPVEVDGKVNGKVEYLGWSHNGKQIVPMVVRPHK